MNLLAFFLFLIILAVALVASQIDSLGRFWGLLAPLCAGGALIVFARIFIKF